MGIERFGCIEWLGCYIFEKVRIGEWNQFGFVASGRYKSADRLPIFYNASDAKLLMIPMDPEVRSTVCEILKNRGFAQYQ